eukprot:4919560-Pyramimonas_sp.AAC.1
MPQDGSRRPPICSKRPQDRPKTTPSGHGAPRGGLPRGHNPSNTEGKPMMFAFSPFRFRWPSDGSKRAQKSPNMGPREPQDDPKSAQERSKGAPRGVQEAILEVPEGGREVGNPSSLIDLLQDGPKTHPWGPQAAPRWLQDGPKMAPSGPQEAPKRALSAPKSPPLPFPRHSTRPRAPQDSQGNPRRPKMSPRSAQEISQEAPKVIQATPGLFACPPPPCLLYTSPSPRDRSLS